MFSLQLAGHKVGSMLSQLLLATLACDCAGLGTHRHKGRTKRTREQRELIVPYLELEMELLYLQSIVF